MAIIYSYPDNLNILLTDMLIGTSTIKVAGKKKNITKNFTVEALGKVISTANPTVWGTIIGSLDDQTDLQAALDSKQNNITLTTIGSNGPSTLIGSVLNIPNYFTVVPTKTSELINDGEDGINPFITLADIPLSTIPNLNDVLLEGNISELDAKIGELYLYDTTNNGYGRVIINSSAFKVYDYLNNPIFANEIGASRVWNTLGVEGVISYSLLTGGRIYSMPDHSGTIALISDIPAQGLTSVGLSMPVAFNVSNSPLTSDGTIAVSAAGTSSQYIRGDGQLATLPSGGGGGSSVNYYLNGSIPSGVVGYQQMDNDAIIGPGTNFALVGNGLVAQFLTDAGNPNRIEIPGGAWNCEMWFSMSSSGGAAKFYIDLLKYDGSTFTLISTGATNPEDITGGTSTDLYLTSLAVPTTTLLATDRLAIRIYIVDNSGGRTATLHTEDNNLCEILTTFSGGVTSLNGLTANTQYLAVGTTGTDFNINSLVDTHTFNLPTASATNRGALSTTDWNTFNSKFNLPALTSGSVLFSDGTTIAQDNSNFFWDNTNNRLGIGATLAAPTSTLDVRGIGTFITNNAPTLLTKIRGSYGQVITIARDDAGNTVGLGVPASGILAFYTNNIETNRINSNGNLLLNTIIDNGGKLQIKAPGALSTDIALRVRNSADSADLLVANGLGYLSVNTSIISHPITISQAINNTSFGIYNTNANVNNRNYTISTNAQAYGDFSIIQSTTNGGNPITAGFTRLYISNTGNVGIGTTAPTSRLHIAAPGALSTDIALRVRNSANTGDLLSINGLGNIDISGKAYIKPGVSGTTALILEPIAAASLSWGYSGNIVGTLSQTSTEAIIRAGSGKNLTFETLGGGENMRILANGNIGIGTTTPTSKLQVVGLASYLDNAAAIVGGLTVGAFYHTAGVVKVVI